MDSDDDMDEVTATARIGEHLRTWRMFLSTIRWFLAAAALLLIGLLMFRTHG